ncbi:hypothetical protein PIB30_036830 [Stylosanthes scabra]|uniref:FAR1 domain-containing protein n=1 Tax=Stylosanthes scabra TaxID=79078 RepID=A0ABU6RDT1_9FABA|nr:hypothetical protein [Stylosanthes scabra]
MESNDNESFSWEDVFCIPDESGQNEAEDVGNEETCLNLGGLSDEDSSKFEDLVGLGEEGILNKDEAGILTRRRFFCNRAGLREDKHYHRAERKRNHRPETQTNCPALLSVYLDKGCGRWRVRYVILGHNHDLTPRGMVHMILATEACPLQQRLR